MSRVPGTKIRKFFLVTIRAATRPLATKSRSAARMYYWADLHMQPYQDTWLLPVWFYRLMTSGCNYIARINTIGYVQLRSATLQKIINWLIHRIPDRIRYCDLYPPDNRFKI
jgi:hypothetical protein